jgi:hypothetical protein
LQKRSFVENRSGQVLVVTALLVALLLLSTALYVIDTTKQVPAVRADAANFIIFDYKQAVRSTMISALANVTGGGNPSILATDLDELNDVLQANSYQSILTFDYNLTDSGSYQNGLWISWGNLGQGVSSAYAAFSVATSSSSATSSVEYTINITSQIGVSGTYQQVNATHKQANITVNVLNEGKAALAESFAVSFQNGADWVAVSSPSITNNVDGSYIVSFSAESDESVEPLFVSLLCIDQRGITIGANYACST